MERNWWIRSGCTGKEVNQVNFLFFIQTLRKITGLKNNKLEGDSKIGQEDA